MKVRATFGKKGAVPYGLGVGCNAVFADYWNWYVGSNGTIFNDGKSDILLENILIKRIGGIEIWCIFIQQKQGPKIFGLLPHLKEYTFYTDRYLTFENSSDLSARLKL